MIPPCPCVSSGHRPSTLCPRCPLACAVPSPEFLLVWGEALRTGCGSVLPGGLRASADVEPGAREAPIGRGRWCGRRAGRSVSLASHHLPCSQASRGTRSLPPGPAWAAGWWPSPTASCPPWCRPCAVLGGGWPGLGSAVGPPEPPQLITGANWDQPVGGGRSVPSCGLPPCAGRALCEAHPWQGSQLLRVPGTWLLQTVP